MFKTPNDYEYAVLDTVPAQEYRIRAGDRLDFQAYSNMGYNQVQSIVPAFDQSGGAGQQGQVRDFLVKNDGTAKLPIIGDVKVAGKTIPEAENFLEDTLEYYHENPWVVLRVTNRRAYVYTGGSESATVVPLTDENLKLIEVITMAGGINTNGKAYKIKLIRGELSDPVVALYDMSTVEGAMEADVIVLPEDIIYIEPTTRAATGLLREISPVLGIIGSLTSLLSIYLLLTRTN